MIISIWYSIENYTYLDLYMWSLQKKLSEWYSPCVTASNACLYDLSEATGCLNNTYCTLLF